MDSVSTNEVFEAIKGQIAQEVDGLDDVVIFDGPLSVATDEHFNRAKAGSRFVFLTLADATPDAVTGYGLPAREGLLVDIYLVFRVQGRGRYDRTREDFWDASDTIVHDAFLISNRATETKAAIAGSQFVSRTRQQTGGDLMAHLIRFIMTPQRAT